MLIVAGLLLVVFHVVAGPWGVTLVAAAIAFEVVEKGFWVRYTSRIPLAAGPEAMIGRSVTVVAACRPAGRVRFGSESWSARCREGADVGESLVIDSVENVTLIVNKPSGPADPEHESALHGLARGESRSHLPLSRAPTRVNRRNSCSSRGV
jgi:membrane protein implicated in regulation of membrane protease activity